MKNKKGWEMVKLGDICTIQTGKFDVNHSVENGEFPFYTCALLPFKSNTYSFDDEVLILPGNGANVGEVMYFNGKFEAYQRTYVIHKINACVKYVYYYMIANWKISQKNQQYGSATNYIRLNNITDLLIPLPPLPEQQRIAALLDAADALRRKDKALLQKYEELAQSVFMDMFGDPVKNEKGWEVRKLGEVTKVGSGSTPNRQNLDYFKGNIPWVKTTEVKGEIIIDTEEHISENALSETSCKLYPKGSVIIAMYGQGKTRGQVGLLDIEAATNQACGVIQPCEKLNPLFLFFYLKQCYVELRSLGRGGNQENLNKGMIEDFSIIIPDKSKQIEFCNRLTSLEKMKSAILINHSEALFASLLQEAFGG